MTTNLQLERACEAMRIPLKGIRFKDQLEQFPTSFDRPGAFLINLQDSHAGAGTHWLALFMPKLQDPIPGHRCHNPAFYFDSFGLLPPREIIRFAKRSGYSDLVHSNEKIQDIHSGYCGQYCLMFLEEMTHGHSAGRERACEAQRSGQCSYPERFKKFIQKYRW